MFQSATKIARFSAEARQKEYPPAVIETPSLF